MYKLIFKERATLITGTVEECEAKRDERMSKGRTTLSDYEIKLVE